MKRKRGVMISLEKVIVKENLIGSVVSEIFQYRQTHKHSYTITYIKGRL